MKRGELEHIIRAAATISADDEIVVIGSQAVLGQFPNAPPELLVSNEADVYPRNWPERWELIDGSIGELSPFHETFGYYAQGVEPGTAILPRGWEQRLVPIANANTRGATGLCLELHDLVIAKYVAGREKDYHFIEAAFRHHLLTLDTLVGRLAETDLPEAHRARILERAQYDATRTA
ncbi:MAG TPA: DUF6036 family nucleotidyltransferase [Polyangiaceae bacterium]|nr:DUF6036 family nucleotidyltransferase [Polyangiaceae bacterium]